MRIYPLNHMPVIKDLAPDQVMAPSRNASLAGA